MTTPTVNQKHADRAVAAMAEELCSVHYTDGFCTPRQKTDCVCVTRARGCLKAMATVGVKPVWEFDPEGADGTH